MKSTSSVEAYIKGANATHRARLREVRALVLACADGVEEAISYGMPAYAWKGKPLFYFAEMKGHLGLYPTSGPIETLKPALRGFSFSKGCVRSPWEDAVPRAIITLLLKERLKEIRSQVST